MRTWRVISWKDRNEIEKFRLSSKVTNEVEKFSINLERTIPVGKHIFDF